jgi:hypothetical protein
MVAPVVWAARVVSVGWVPMVFRVPMVLVQVTLEPMAARAAPVAPVVAVVRVESAVLQAD